MSNKNKLLVFGIVLAAVFIFLSKEILSQSCDGQCGNITEDRCDGGNWVTGRCPGPPDIQCCVGGTVQTQCTYSSPSGSGECADTTIHNCDTSWQPRRCLDHGINVLCCVGTITVKAGEDCVDGGYRCEDGTFCIDGTCGQELVDVSITPISVSVKASELFELRVICSYGKFLDGGGFDTVRSGDCDSYEGIVWASPNRDDFIVFGTSSQPSKPGNYLFGSKSKEDMDFSLAEILGRKISITATLEGITASHEVTIKNKQHDYECPEGQCAGEPLEDPDCQTRGGYYGAIGDNVVANCLEKFTNGKCCDKAITCVQRYDKGDCVNENEVTCGEDGFDRDGYLCAAPLVCCKDKDDKGALAGQTCTGVTECSEGHVCVTKPALSPEKRCYEKIGEQLIQWIKFTGTSITAIKGEDAPEIPIECVDEDDKVVECTGLTFTVTPPEAGEVISSSPYKFRIKEGYTRTGPVRVTARLATQSAITTIQHLTVNIGGTQIDSIELSEPEPHHVDLGGQARVKVTCKKDENDDVACEGLTMNSPPEGITLSRDRSDILVTVAENYDFDTHGDFTLIVSSDTRQAEKLIDILKATIEYCGEGGVTTKNIVCEKDDQDPSGQCKCPDTCFTQYKILYGMDGDCMTGARYDCKDNSAGYQCVSNKDSCADPIQEEKNSNCGTGKICCVSKRYDDIDVCVFATGYPCTKPENLPCRCPSEEDPEECNSDSVITRIPINELANCGGVKGIGLITIPCGEECPKDRKETCICAADCVDRGDIVEKGKKCGERREMIAVSGAGGGCGKACEAVQGCVCPGYCEAPHEIRQNEVCGDPIGWDLRGQFRRVFSPTYFLNNFFRATDPYLMSFAERQGWNDWPGSQLLERLELNRFLFWQPERWEIITCKVLSSTRKIPEGIDVTFGRGGTVNVVLPTVRYLLQAERTEPLPDNTTTYQFNWNLRFEENATFALSVHYCGRDEEKQDELCPDGKDVVEWTDISYITDPDTGEEMSAVFIEVGEGETKAVNDFKAVNTHIKKDTFCITYRAQTDYTAGNDPSVYCVYIQFEDYTKITFGEEEPPKPSPTKPAGDEWISTTTGDEGF